MADELSADEKAYFESRGGEEGAATPATAPKGDAAPADGGGAVEQQDGGAAVSETGQQPVKTDGPAGQQPPKTEGSDDRRVPLAALQEERQRRQDLQQRLESEARARAELEARLKAVEDRTAPPAEQPPDFETDPAGYLRWEQQRIVARQAEFERQAAAQAQDATLRNQALMLQNYGAAREREFMATMPDYPEAIGYLRAQRAAELGALYPTADPAAIAQTIDNDYSAILIQAAQRGANPAEALYGIARARGYAPKGAAANTNGEAAAPSATERVATLAAGQKQAQSVGAAHGTAPARASIQTVLAMPDDEFAKLSEAEFRRLAGG